MSASEPRYRPRMSTAGLSPTHPAIATDEFGKSRDVHIAGESPLTIKVDDRELVTLMTLGTHPEELALGYLRNQRLIERIEDIDSVNVDWDEETVRIETYARQGIVDWQRKLSKRTLTSGCAQGTLFSCTLDKLYDQRLPRIRIRQSLVYALLQKISAFNEIYRRAGAVHGCALCKDAEIITFIEDVGRHNAADAISGHMWLERIGGADKVFYTTGRLTSEIVIKSATMGIPLLLSRSGITNMGLELARDLGITLIARAKGRHFLVYSGKENIKFDAVPPRRETGESQDSKMKED